VCKWCKWCKWSEKDVWCVVCGVVWCVMCEGRGEISAFVHWIGWWIFISQSRFRLPDAEYHILHSLSASHYTLYTITLHFSITPSFSSFQHFHSHHHHSSTLTLISHFSFLIAYILYIPVSQWGHGTSGDKYYTISFWTKMIYDVIWCDVDWVMFHEDNVR
jgi:hypothetical protein